jgi:hypothetical protein
MTHGQSSTTRQSRLRGSSADGAGGFAFEASLVSGGTSPFEAGSGARSELGRTSGGAGSSCVGTTYCIKRS